MTHETPKSGHGGGIDLPPEVVEAAGDTGIELPDGSLAWSPTQCVQLIDSLHGTKIAIPEAELYRSRAIGLVPLYQGWNCERTPGETATDYALRSRDLALARVTTLVDEIFVVLHFDDQRDAA